MFTGQRPVLMVLKMKHVNVKIQTHVPVQLTFLFNFRAHSLAVLAEPITVRDNYNPK